MRLTKEELESQRLTATLRDEERTLPGDEPNLQVHNSTETTFIASMFASDLGRKVIIGALVMLLLIILIAAFLFVPIPGPDKP